MRKQHQDRNGLLLRGSPAAKEVCESRPRRTEADYDDVERVGRAHLNSMAEQIFLRFPQE